MGGPKKKGPSAQEQFNTKRQGLESALQGKSTSTLTKATRDEFQRRVEALAGASAGEDPSKSITPGGAAPTENVAALNTLEAEILSAQKGEGRFGERQALQEKRNLLKDRPGRSQIFKFG